MTTRQVQKFGQERRKKSREQDTYYQVVVTLNSLAWLSLVICLILFHFARPEMVSGVQQFWGIEGRTSWAPQYIDALIMLLQGCLVTSLLTMFLRSRRNRRKTDRYGVNLFILAGISSLSLVTLNAAALS
ncbi:hypothetical protein [uncultured Alteromonas sp.]|jgi:hypothetical protein|uniref:hypothetical protein n=1 Tax=uncultured Alteromonas sp. TaxID=179113 RepID=UPI0025F43E26|nr:hypothetical protein [uncultured Alteromonas sp.]